MKREQIIRQLKGVEELETIEPLKNLESGYDLDRNNKFCDEIEPSGEPSLCSTQPLENMEKSLQATSTCCYIAH
jgi:hypothetical protein